MDQTQPAVVRAPVDAEDLQSVDMLCGLEGCGNPLPPPVIDEHGRRKGGRPSRYCSKAHTDAASRARRVRDTTAVSDPLSEVRSIGAALLPGVRELAASLAMLDQRFTEAEQRAFAQVTHAETEATQAREDAAEAVAQAEQAQRARREALAQARDHQVERDRAVKDAERARHDAEETRAQAWDTVAVHERARGQAEAAHIAAGTERDQLATELRATRTQLEHDRAEHARLTTAFTSAQAGLTDTHRELDQLRQQFAQARTRLGELKDQLRAEREQRRLSQAQAQELEIELRAARDRVTDANTRVDTLIAANIASSSQSRHTTSPTPGAASSLHPIWLGWPTTRPTADHSHAPSIRTASPTSGMVPADDSTVEC